MGSKKNISTDCRNKNTRNMEIGSKHLLALSSLRLLLVALTMLLILNNCELLGVDGGNTLELGDSLTGNQTLTSKNGTFELGFFSPSGTNKWYVGIWYAQIPVKTIVWVANRETPLENKPGVLNMSTDGHLRLYDLEGRLMWSANNRHKASRASILDSGNFVLLGQNNMFKIVWESFAYPGDTWLPEMKMWKGLSLTSWKSSEDPAPGPFSLIMDPSPGKTRLLLFYQKNVSYWSSGEWTSDHFTNMPELSGASMFNIVNTPTSRMYFTLKKFSPSRIYFMYTVNSTMQKIQPPRVVVQKNGQAQAFIWMDNSGWRLVGSKPTDQCKIYGVCGNYATCNNINTQLCSCLEGFRPKDNQAWDSQDFRSSGCIRRSPLQCSINGSGTADGFLEVKGKSLPQKEAVVRYVGEQTWDRCRSACLSNCTCTAFVFVGFTAPFVCLMWFQDLSNMCESSDGQSIFIRLAASDLPSSSSKAKDRKPALSLLIPVGVVVLALLFTVIIFLWRRGRLLKACKNDDMPTSLRTFTYKELKIATKNFRQKLGSGAFGSVFKGTLRDNTLVAVKRLESSRQAEKQFRAEISTIGSIQHVNLVRLRGFCIERSQRLLVYEYMSNGSLNSFLFSKSKRDEAHNVLEWKTRFEIALGTARGLVYLHEECRDRIIHCDIKPENILLDEKFCPKVADFGLAKLVGRDFSRVLTTTRGTRGYLAPEWVSGLPITCKADVYSFGMTMLEILSGRRNLDLTVENSSRCYFPSWAANQLQEGNITGVADTRIASHADIEELRRVLVVSLLCVQEDENMRPSMVEVVQILKRTMEPCAPPFQSFPMVLLNEQAKQDGKSDGYDKS